MKANKSALHDFEILPDGVSIKDVEPAFSEVIAEEHIGKMNSCCASCRKPFSHVRKPRREIRLYPIGLPVPIAFAYAICGRCAVLYRKDRQGRDAVLSSVEAFSRGEEPNQ